MNPFQHAFLLPQESSNPEAHLLLQGLGGGHGATGSVPGGTAASNALSCRWLNYRKLLRREMLTDLSAHPSRKRPPQDGDPIHMVTKLVKKPRPQQRRIPRAPVAILQAANLQDDFYLSLVAWGGTRAKPVLAAGLGSTIALWTADPLEVGLELASHPRNPGGSAPGMDMASSCHLGASCASVGTVTAGPSIAFAEWSHRLETEPESSQGNSASPGRPATGDSQQQQQASASAASAGRDTNITCLSWAKGKGQTLLACRGIGDVEMWDMNKCKKIFSREGRHSQKIGISDWLDDKVYATGSRDTLVKLWDLRQQAEIGKIGPQHQEVCGLAWSCDGQYRLATGSNDNRLIVWDLRHVGSTTGSVPIAEIRVHKAAVKALSWCPHRSNLLASGGGTIDRTIRLWDISSSEYQCAGKVDTGAQVCSIAWSPTSMELVSSHGYSLNQIIAWSCFSGNVDQTPPEADEQYVDAGFKFRLSRLGTLTGHTSRALYMSLAPDGRHVATGAGDSSVRIWNVFER